jgi:hypothetical protein
LHALADLAPGPRADALALVVRRGGGQLVTLRVPLADAPPLADWRLLGLCLAAAPILLFLFARLGMPAPAALAWGLRSQLTALRGRAGWPLLVGAVLSTGLGVYATLAASLFDPFVLLVLHLAGVLSLWGLREKGAQRLAADALGVWAGALCVVAVSGTRAWPLLLRDQGALPWAWNALSRLPLTAACLLFVLSAARLHRALARRAEQRMAAQLWEHGLSGLLAPLCASLFFGGAFVAPSASALALLMAAVLAAVKSLVCYGLLRLVAGIKLLGARNWLWISLIALTPLWVGLVPGRPFELIWGSAACVLCVCIAIAGVVSLRSPQPQPATAKPAPRKAAAAAPQPRAAAAPARIKVAQATAPQGAPKTAARHSNSPRTTRPLPQTQS